MNTASWRGVTFDDLLAAAAVNEPPAPFVMAHSDGGYTTNVPVADLVGGKGGIVRLSQPRRPVERAEI
jgi:hypothetical protein